MNCPKDNNELVLVNKEGAELSYCPTCAGVWMDRKDLDIIIEKSCSDDISPVDDIPVKNSETGDKERGEDPKFKDNPSARSGKKSKDPGDSYFGRLFNFHKL